MFSDMLPHSYLIITRTEYESPYKNVTIESDKLSICKDTSRYTMNYLLNKDNFYFEFLQSIQASGISILVKSKFIKSSSRRDKPIRTD